MRWLTNSYDFRFKWTATAEIGIHPTKAWLSQLGMSNMQSGHEDTLKERYAIKFCFKLGKRATETYGILSIKVPIRKKSGNLFNDPRMFNQICINEEMLPLPKYVYIREKKRERERERDKVSEREKERERERFKWNTTSYCWCVKHVENEITIEDCN